MDNVTDALKMAADVLVFVIALSITILSFTEARQIATEMIGRTDREYITTYVDENGGATQRIVSGETVIPTLYRAYKENYKIVFAESTFGNDGIYKKRNNEGGEDPIYYIDLEREVIGDENQKEEFIRAILYGSRNNDWLNLKDKFKTNKGISLQDTGIYDKIKGKRFKEELGIYYQEETTGESLAPDAEKVQKRVITYTPI